METKFDLIYICKKYEKKVNFSWWFFSWKNWPIFRRASTLNIRLWPLRPPITWPGLARRARRFWDSQKLNTHSEPPEMAAIAKTDPTYDPWFEKNFQPRWRSASIYWYSMFIATHVKNTRPTPHTPPTHTPQHTHTLLKCFNTTYLRGLTHIWNEKNCIKQQDRLT